MENTFWTKSPLYLQTEREGENLWSILFVLLLF